MALIAAFVLAYALLNAVDGREPAEAACCPVF